MRQPQKKPTPYSSTTSSMSPSNHPKNLPFLSTFFPTKSLLHSFAPLYPTVPTTRLKDCLFLSSNSMESFASNSTPPHDVHHHSHHRHRPNPHFTLMQAFVDRVDRALKHRLRLLHRSDSTFFILGATGNVYIVTLSTTPSCTCPDRATPCKHILFTLIRVLGVPLDNTCLRKKVLKPCQLNRLLKMPTYPETLASINLRERFHQLYFHGRQGSLRSHIEIEDGAMCPVCLEVMGWRDNMVVCGTCRNPIHQKCFMNWKRSQGRRSVNCVICRARWQDRADQEKYLNLAAYIDEEDNTAEPHGEGQGICGD